MQPQQWTVKKLTFLYYRFIYNYNLICYHISRNQGDARKGKRNDPQTVFGYLQFQISGSFSVQLL